MPGESKDTINIRELILLPADINNEEFSDWISINKGFSIRIVGDFTGDVTIQRRNKEGDTRVGDVQSFSTQIEEQGEAAVKQSMEYRIGVKANAVTAIPSELYLALVR